MNTNERSSSPSNISGSNVNRLNNNNSKQYISKGQDLTATSNTASLKSTRTMNSFQRQPSTIQQIESNHTPTTQSNRSISGNRSILGNGNTTSSVISDLRTARGSQPIYAWEESNERTERVPIEINEITFLPSKQLGFYTRNDIINPASTTGTPLLLHVVPLALLLVLISLLLYYYNNYNV